MPHLNTANTYIELSTSAFAHNIATYKQLIGAADLGIVVKGNAYGHGLDEIVSLTKDNPHINWYFTATLSEALYIRSLGITKPILVMSIIDQDPLLAFQNNIRLIFHQREQFADLERAHAYGLRPPVHLKVDTGLSRFGFLPHECIDIVQHLQQMSHVTLEGIFTHFAQAELPDQAYTDLQTERFASLIHELAHTVHIPFVHSHATSAALVRGPECTNLFRIGAGLYGLWPSTDVQQRAEQNLKISLRQILTWKTRIINMRTVPAHTPIGYGCTHIATRTMRIAQLPVGYADGYHRRLSNVGNVLIGDRLAPIIGRVGMNSITIDITHIPCAQLGTEVILTGPHPEVTALDLACAIKGYNPREIVTGIICKNRSIVT